MDVSFLIVALGDYDRQVNNIINQNLDFSYERPGQDVRYSISCNHLKQYGWNPTKMFDTEIQSIVKHYREKFVW